MKKFGRIIKNNLSFIITFVVIAALLVSALFIFGIRIVTVDGPSMDTTLESGEKLVMTNFNYTPRTGDIIVVSKGASYDHPFIKRVIATGGQRLKLDYENDAIYVDGKKLEEPYTGGSAFDGNYGNYTVPEVVPEGKLFVMGDNRYISKDSRSADIGLVDSKSVMGKAQIALFPFNRLGLL